MEKSVRIYKKSRRGGRVRPSASNVSLRWRDLDQSEQMSVVCNFFCDGAPFAEIARLINKQYSAKINRESVYPIVRNAVKRGWVRFVPPPELSLQGKLMRRFDHLKKVKVVHTCRFTDVAYHAAEMLIDLLSSLKAKGKDEAHMGFAGGHAMRKLAKILSVIISDTSDRLPNTIVFHAMAAGFDVIEPTTAPTTFFTFFTPIGPESIRFKYVGFFAPSVVKSDVYNDLRSSEGIKQSYKHASEIDIIVSSATNWSDQHSTFRKYMKESKENCFEVLDSAECVGDMLWLPVGENGPIQAETKRRTMTLVELNDLPGFIRSGKDVVLVLGPCSQCNRPKSEILSAILKQSTDRLITHLVADSQSVREVLK